MCCSASERLTASCRPLRERMTNQYSALIEWSDEDDCFIGSAYPLVGQCCHGETRAKVAGKLETIIEDLLDDPDWLKNVPELPAKKRSGRITS